MMLSGSDRTSRCGGGTPPSRHSVRRPVLRAVRPILAPTNLGLRPLQSGKEPGAWQAPEVLMSAGLGKLLASRPAPTLHRPAYSFKRQAGTSIRNGAEIRRYSDVLADAVAGTMETGAFPLVIGGDCSILLGCLLGARRHGRCGLIHVDGHSDFLHFDADLYRTPLSAAAGMDLALATGRGEPLLTRWPGDAWPLVRGHEVVQIGDREAGGSDDMLPATIRRIDVHAALRLGPRLVGHQVVTHLHVQRIARAWIHLDLDVLDERVMPAVDSPGQPGVDFGFLRALLGDLLRCSKIEGMNVTIYDPDHDPDRIYASGIVECLVDAFTDAGRFEACTPGALSHV
jgi:arginase